MKYNVFIIKAAQEALKPSTSADGLDLPVEIVREIHFHKDKALFVEDFEGFMNLAEQITEELGLAPVQDLAKVASVLNFIRKEAGLCPL